MKSGTWFGSTPYPCRTSSGPMRVISPPRDGQMIVVHDEDELKRTRIAAGH
jgi:hypothetical protein